MEIDYCIAGLGNPGARYFNTRHNIGFITIDRLAEFFKIESFMMEDHYLYAIAEYNGKNIALLKPLTYMNLSGKAVKTFCEKHNIKNENTLIIYDDINLDFGVLRMRPSGSDGGQNGIKSVIYEMQSEDIPRLRIGVWNDDEFEKTKIEDGYNLAEFVLSDFVEDEMNNLDKVTEAAKDAVLLYAGKGIKEAMNKYNKRVLENENSGNTNDIKGENNN